MIYIVPINAITEAEVITVNSEAEVAQYFLTSNDKYLKPIYKIMWLVFSGVIINLLFFQLPRKLYLQYVYSRLKKGMFSDFFWGKYNLVQSFFRPILKR